MAACACLYGASDPRCCMNISAVYGIPGPHIGTPPPEATPYIGDPFPNYPWQPPVRGWPPIPYPGWPPSPPSGAWVCPACGSGNAPGNPTCQNCPPKTVTAPHSGDIWWHQNFDAANTDGVDYDDAKDSFPPFGFPDPWGGGE